MKSFYIFLLTIISIIVLVFFVCFGFFAHILYKKYKYLFKIVRKMENDKYLWPLNKKLSRGVAENLNTKGKILLIGVGSCSILDNLVKKTDKQIDVIDSNQYLLDLAKEKHGSRCNYINGDVIYYKFDTLYENVISSLPHKEFSLDDIDRIFTKYYNLSLDKVIYLESKMPHVKNSYVKMWQTNKNKELEEKNYKWELLTKKNYKNIPPVNLCILSRNKLN